MHQVLVELSGDVAIRYGYKRGAFGKNGTFNLSFDYQIIVDIWVMSLTVQMVPQIVLN